MVAVEQQRGKHQSVVWVWLVVTLLAAAANVPYVLRSELTTLGRVAGLLWILVPCAWVLLGGFITSRKPGNTVGLLMLLPGAAAVNISRPLVTLAEAPATVDLPTWVGLYVDNVTWLFLFMPVIALLAVFPTGRPLSRRWMWHLRLIAGMAAFLLVYGVFAAWLGPTDESWRVANPIGFLPDIFATAWFLALWVLGLLVITVAGLASVVLRYRRAGWRERDQLRWLLLAFGLFAVVYIGEALLVSGNDGPRDGVRLLGLLLPLTIVFIPVAMAIAIQHHRVLDIDVVIRRTVSYGLLTAMLSLVYVSAVVGLEGLSRRLAGGDSSVAVALATLLTAILFNPVRSRVQRFVARRFFRGEYDAEQVLGDLRRVIDGETDADRVAELLLAAATDTLHPTTIGLLNFEARPASTARPWGNPAASRSGHHRDPV